MSVINSQRPNIQRLQSTRNIYKLPYNITVKFLHLTPISLFLATAWLSMKQTRQVPRVGGWSNGRADVVLFAIGATVERAIDGRHCPPSSYACLRGPNAPSTADRLALHVLAHCSPPRSLRESLVCLGGKRVTGRGWSGSLDRSPGKSTAEGGYIKATGLNKNDLYVHELLKKK